MKIKKSYDAWSEKTAKLNENQTLHLGDQVIDFDGQPGVVVRIILGYTIEDRGTIYVWQQDRTKYGDDNCEHYSFYEWKSYLRIIN
jgi:hypothetical protein